MIFKLIYKDKEIIREVGLEELYSRRILTLGGILEYCCQLYNFSSDNISVFELSEKKRDGFFLIDFREYYRYFYYLHSEFKFLDEIRWEFLDESSYEYNLSYILSNKGDNLYYFYILLDEKYKNWLNWFPNNFTLEDCEIRPKINNN